MFYIKPTYPELDWSRPNILFHSWLGEFSVVDNNDNLTFSGDYYIYSNSELPVGSYYLNFKTFFASVTNINLIFNKNVLTQKSNNNIAYKVDQYKFSFDLLLKNSSYFQEHILYKNIEFNITPNINVSIFNDYKINVSTSDLNEFMLQLQYAKDYNAFVYKNCFDLNKQNDSINISLNNNKKAIIYYDVENFINKQTPINNIIKINKLDSSPFIINTLQIKFNYVFNNKPYTYEFKKKNLTFYNESFVIKIDDSLLFDTQNNKIITYDGMKGIFLSSLSGNFECVIDFSYLNQKRTLLLNRDFSFTDINTIALNLIKVLPYQNNKKLINGVQSEAIY